MRFFKYDPFYVFKKIFGFTFLVGFFYFKELYLLLLFADSPYYGKFILVFTLATSVPYFISSSSYNYLLREVSNLNSEINLSSIEKALFPKIAFISLISLLIVLILKDGLLIESIILLYIFQLFDTLYIVPDSRLKINIFLQRYQQ